MEEEKARAEEKQRKKLEEEKARMAAKAEEEKRKAAEEASKAAAKAEEERRRAAEEASKAAAKAEEEKRKAAAKAEEEKRKEAAKAKEERRKEAAKAEEEKRKEAAKAEEEKRKEAAKAKLEKMRAAAKAEEEARKAELARKLELLGNYEEKVKAFDRSRVKRESQWTDGNWYKREYDIREKLEKRQSDLLKKQVKYMWDNSPFMKRKLEEAGITKPGNIKSCADITKLPFTSNVDLAKSQQERPPFGDVCCVEPEELTDIRMTGATAAVPRLFLTSRRETTSLYHAVRPLVAAGVTNADVVVFLFDVDSFWTFRLWHDVLRHDFGCAVIPTASLDDKKRVEVIDQLKATVLIGSPSSLLSLAEAARTAGIDPAGSSARILLTGVEPGIGSDPAVGKKLEEAWGAKNFELAGSQDVGIFAWTCEERDGLHLMEDDYLFEIVDPKTDQPVREGKDGELVVTPLLVKTTPVTRFRTQDIVSLITEPCPCRRPMRRISGFKGRTEQKPIPPKR